MSNLLHDLIILVEEVITAIGYPGITLMMILENVFPPIPSEVVMPYAGFLAEEGKFNVLAVWASGTLGSVIGALILYYVGYWAEDHIIVGVVRRYGQWLMLTEADLEKALNWFDKHGEVVVFFGRLVPVVRSLISIPAGMDKMHLGRFLFFSTLGSSIWTGVLTYAGYMLGENWEDVVALVAEYQRVTIVIIGIALVVLGIRRFYIWRNTSSVPRSSLPEEEVEMT